MSAKAFGKSILALAAALLLSVTARAGENGAGLNPRVVAMNDNTWLKMSAENNPRSRMYSSPWFADGKLYYFGGGHFSYTYNDVEVYDLAGNAWKKITKPERPAEGKGHSDWGRIASEQASPSGAPYVTHTYQYGCWDPARERFFLPFRQSGVWEFDPGAAKWDNVLNVFTDPRPKTPHDLGFGLMAGIHSSFSPELGKPVTVVTWKARGFYLFDHEKKAWVRHKPLPKILNGAELYSTYVPEWKAHLMVRGGKQAIFYRVDLAAGTAEKLECPADIKRCMALAYDSAAKTVIVMPMVDLPGKGPNTVSVWALDPEKLKWTDLKTTGAPKGNNIGKWAPLWYDAAHNAHIFLNTNGRGATYQGGSTGTWCYRYKRANGQQ